MTKKQAHFTMSIPEDQLREYPPIVCTDQDGQEMYILKNIPFEILVALDLWLKRLPEINGGYGEMTFRIQAGLFKSASCRETLRFPQPGKTEL